MVLDHELKHPLLKTTVALIAKARKDRTESLWPCRAEFDRLVVYQPTTNDGTHSDLSTQQALLAVRSSNPAAVLNASKIKVTANDKTSLAAARLEVVRLRAEFPGTEEALTAGQMLETEAIRGAGQSYTISDISEESLASLRSAIGDELPPELVGYLGDSRLKHWDDIWGLDFSPTGQEIECLAWSPDQRLVAVGMESVSTTKPTNVSYIVDVGTSKVVAKLPCGHSSTRGIAFSADGASVITFGFDGMLRRFDLERAIEAKESILPQSLLVSEAGGLGVDISPSGKQLVTSAKDGAVRFVDVETWQITKQMKIGPDQGWVNSVTYSPDGTHVSTANANGTVSILAAPLPASTADGKHVVAGAGTNIQRLSYPELNPEKAISGVVGSVFGMSINEDESQIVIASDDAQICEIRSLAGDAGTPIQIGVETEVPHHCAVATRGCATNSKYQRLLRDGRTEFLFRQME